MIYVGRVSVGRQLNLWSNAEYSDSGEASNIEEVLLYFAIKHC